MNAFGPARAWVLAALGVAALSFAPACTAVSFSAFPSYTGARVSVLPEPAACLSCGRVDLLFMIDNSPSTAPMTAELQRRFPDLISAFSQLAQAGVALDLHLGVVTSDYGAGLGAPGCDPSPGGQLGRLQALGQAADPACKRPGADTSDDKYIEYKFTGAAEEPNNLPAGQDLAATFRCMSSVGERGCGFVHPLESVYAALHGTGDPADRFLRDDARLVVVFLTDKDDGSTPPITDLFDEKDISQYGYPDAYRQTRFGVLCGSPPARPPYGAASQVLYDCQPAPNPGGQGPGLEYDVSRYIDFFDRPRAEGGVKTRPSDVTLVGIVAPATPFRVGLASPVAAAASPGAAAQGASPIACPALDQRPASPCVPTLMPSCVSPADPRFFGVPPVRLNAVIDAAPQHAIYSICDDDFSSAIAGLGQLIAAEVEGDDALCIDQPLFRGPDGTVVADCVVGDTTSRPDGSTQTAALPACSRAAPPCWRALPSPACADRSPDGLALVVDRAGGAAPGGSWVTASCVLAP